MLEAVCAKVTATPGALGWAQVHEFVPDEPNKIAARGKLFAVFATKKVEGGVDTITSGRELIARLHEEYFGNLDDRPFDALKKAVEKVSQEFRNSWGDVEITACSFTNGAVYSAAVGGARIMISRKGALATILESKDSAISASGYPQAGDVMLLATKTFFEKIPIGVLKAALSSTDVNSAAEVFAPIVHSEGGMGNLGAAIVKFDDVANFEAVSSVKQIVTPPSSIKKSFSIFPVEEKIKSFWKSIQKRLPERRIYVRSGVDDEVTSHSKKLTFTVGIILLVILLISIGFGVRQKRINDIKNKYQGILKVAQAEVDQAISLASIDPEKSRQLFADSEEKLNQIKALKVTDPKVAALMEKISESSQAILGEYHETPSLFLDLSLLSSGFNGDTITLSGGSIFILDESGKRIVSVATDTKKSKVVAGPGVINEAFALASYQDRVFVLTSNGIYEVDNILSKVIDKTWVGDALIKAFAGNIYVLDKSAGAIYRYTGTGQVFGDKQNWLSASTKTDFTNSRSWAIDGSVYVLFPNSKVLKYSLGSPQGFSVTSVTPQIGNIDAIYADPDNQFLYLLDRAGKRVVVTDKKGAYKAQYIDDKISTATNLVVSEANKKIILLTGDKLLSIDLKNI